MYFIKKLVVKNEAVEKFLAINQNIILSLLKQFYCFGKYSLSA